MKQAMIMGVLNVTPDSFYDGGFYFDHEKAIEHGLKLAEEGADIIDVGGESTRPGASPVPVDEELRRVLPVIEALSSRVRVSVDTFKKEVAEASVAAGATMINDVGGTLADMASALGTALVVMHKQGTYQDMQNKPYYKDVVKEVYSDIISRANKAAEKDISEIYIDPGIGFGKTADHNLALLAHLPFLSQGGNRFPLLVGVSRKRFLGHIIAQDKKPDRLDKSEWELLPEAAADRMCRLPHLNLTQDSVLPPGERKEASLAVAAFMLFAGVEIVRVHDVAETKYIVNLMGDR